MSQIAKLVPNEFVYDHPSIRQWPLSVVLSILIAPATCFADLPSSYDYYPGSPLILGANFDPNHITDAKTPCLKYTTDSIPQGAVNTSFSESLITTSSDLRTALHIDASIDAQYLAFKGSASFSYDESRYTHSQNVSFVMRAYTEFGTRNIISAELLPDAKILLATPVEFVKTCGSQYVKIERRGASVAAIITLENVDSDFKRDFSTELAASGGIGAFSASFKSKLKTQMDLASTELRLKVDVVSTGGDGFGALSDVIAKTSLKPGNYDAIFGALSTYIAKFNKDNAAPIAFTVANIPGLDQALSDLWPLQKEKAIEALVTEYRAFTSYRLQLGAIANDADPRSALISVAEKQQLQAAIPSFDDYLQRLATVHAACKSASTADAAVCALPNSRPDPSIVPPPLSSPVGAFRIIEASREQWPGIYWPAAQSAGVFSQPDVDTPLVVRVARISGTSVGVVGIGFVLPDPYFVDASIFYRLDSITTSTGSAAKISREYGPFAHFSREEFTNFVSGRSAKHKSLDGPNGPSPVIAFDIERKDKSDRESVDYATLATSIPYEYIEMLATVRTLALSTLEANGGRTGEGIELFRVRNIAGLSQDYPIGHFAWTLSDTRDAQQKSIAITFSLPGFSKTDTSSVAVCDSNHIATIENKCVPKVCPDGHAADFILGCIAPPARRR